MSTKNVVFLNLAVLAGLAINLMQCANPVDDPPLKWRSNVEIPVTNERFIIGEELDNLFNFEDLDILNVVKKYYDDPSQLKPDTVKGDTVIFSASKTDSSEFETHEDPFPGREYRVKIGPIPVSGAPEQHASTTLLPVAGSFSVGFSQALDGVYSIAFYDTSTNLMRVRLINTGADTLSDVALGIGGIDTGSVALIAPGDTAIIDLDAAGKSIDDTARFYVAADAPAGAGKSVAIDYSLNGLIARELRVADRLVNFSVEYVNPYELTDTVDVDYIDIGDGFFNYQIRNYTGLDFHALVVHEHMWTTSFSQRNNLAKVEDLTDLDSADSSEGFLGTITNSPVTSFAHQEQSMRNNNISRCRMFPEWDEGRKKSVTRVKYTLSTGTPTGAAVTISAADSLLFTISSTGFKFRELQGTLTESYERQSDTQKVAINLPWNNSVKDSLRGRFILEKVWGDILVRTVMPERAFLDTLRIDFIAFAPESTTVQDSMSTALINVSKDSTYFRSINITRVANLYSDSVAIAVRVYVPKGTRIHAVNDLDDTTDFIGRMVIHVNTSYRLNAKLDWEVVGMVNMDLGSARFKLDEAFDFFSRLEDRSATFEMWLRNYSNLNLSLLALVAADTLMDTLDSLDMNQVYTLLKNPALAEQRGYINLFGDTGISVPKRDTLLEQYNAVRLNDQQLGLMFGADSLNFRWWIQFREQDRDALIDTDYVDMRSRLNVQGVNNTDSLLIWE